MRPAERPRDGAAGGGRQGAALLQLQRRLHAPCAAAHPCAVLTHSHSAVLSHMPAPLPCVQIHYALQHASAMRCTAHMFSAACQQECHTPNSNIAVSLDRCRLCAAARGSQAGASNRRQCHRRPSRSTARASSRRQARQRQGSHSARPQAAPASGAQAATAVPTQHTAAACTAVGCEAADALCVWRVASLSSGIMTWWGSASAACACPLQAAIWLAPLNQCSRAAGRPGGRETREVVLPLWERQVASSHQRRVPPPGRPNVAIITAMPPDACRHVRAFHSVAL